MSCRCCGCFFVFFVVFCLFLFFGGVGLFWLLFEMFVSDECTDYSVAESSLSLAENGLKMKNLVRLDGLEVRAYAHIGSGLTASWVFESRSRQTLLNVSPLLSLLSVFH